MEGTPSVTAYWLLHDCIAVARQTDLSSNSAEWVAAYHDPAVQWMVGA